MSTDRRFFFTPNVVIGLGVIAVGVALMLDRLGVLDARELLQLWPVLLILLGASIVAQAIWGDPEQAGPGSGAAGFWLVLMLVGLFVWQAHGRRDPTARDTNAEVVNLFAVMGGDHRTSFTSQFRGADMTSIMGRTTLDLRETEVGPGEEPVVDVVVLMGGAVVYVPRDWVVDVQATPLMGRVRDVRTVSPEEEREARRNRERRRERVGVLPGGANVRETLEPLEAPDDDRPPTRVVLRGFIMMGELTIRS